MGITRRDFLKIGVKAGIVGALSTTPFYSFAKKSKPKSVNISILHTNDVHSRIEPFPNDGTKYARQGGFARRAALVGEIRKVEKNVLLLDAGDMWQGTPYFNYFGGEIEYKLMNQMGYDFATLGNHDFDAGLDGLHKQLPNAKFGILNANYDFSKTILRNSFMPNTIVEKEGVKIGIYGIGIDLRGLVPDKLWQGVLYNDPIDIAKAQEEDLKNKDCDIIICLSHLGYKYDKDQVSDQDLANLTQHTDLIIGGHTHTFLNEPQLVKRKSNREVYINQVGWAGLRLGRIDYNFELSSKKKRIKSDTVKIS